MISFPSELDQPETPADHDLKRRLINFLYARQVPGMRSLRIAVQHGMVTIQGSLPSPEAKRLCLECCRHVAGVIELKDAATISGT